jgi:predicted nucleic acid-binding protein
LIVLDSSAWIEYQNDGPLADELEKFVGGDEAIAVPAVVLYEVYRAVQRMRGDDTAALAAFQLRERGVVDVDARGALKAANLASEHGLHMADAMIYAATLSVGGTLVTLDAHFEGLPGVVYLQKQSPRAKKK